MVIVLNVQTTYSALFECLRCSLILQKSIKNSKVNIQEIENTVYCITSTSAQSHRPTII